MKQKLNLTQISMIEQSKVKAGAETGCKDCGGDIICYIADSAADGCGCSSIFVAFGLNQGAVS